jgi:hypothetical protein
VRLDEPSSTRDPVLPRRRPRRSRLWRRGRALLGLTSPNSPPVVVEWPFRYSAREENGRVALLDETGTVVALEGEMVQMGGGMGQQNIWFTCGPVERLDAIR